MDALPFAGLDLARAVNCYRLTCKPCRAVKAAPRKYHAFVYFLEGESAYTYRDCTLRTAQDSFLFLPKGQPYEIDRFGQIGAIVLDFESHQEDLLPPCCRSMRSRDLASLFERALRAARGAEASEVRLKSVFYAMIDVLQKTDSALAYSPSPTAKMLAPAIAYLHERFEDASIDNGMLAAKCGVGERYFCKRFVQTMGVTPHRYLVQLRLQSAKTLLKTHDLSVAEIAENCGFGTVYYFSRLFKEQTGMTPTEYRTRPD